MAVVSVLMCVYNEEPEILKSAVESILQQTFQEFEYIIIVDNPKRLDLIDYIKGVAIQDQRVQYSVNSVNRGLVDSLNKGLSMCKGTYVARMDADDMAAPNRLEKQYQYIKLNNLDMIGCFVDLIKNENSYGKMSDKLPIHHKNIVRYLKTNGCIYHPTWFVKREVYKELGGYRHIETCEDYDLLLRATMFGFQLGNLPEVVFHYRVSTNGITQKNKGRQKLLVRLLSKQLKHNITYTEQQINEYLNTHTREEKRLYQYYERVEALRFAKQKGDYSSMIKVMLQVGVTKFPYMAIVDTINCHIWAR